MKKLKPFFTALLPFLCGCMVTTHLGTKYLIYPLDYDAKLSFKPDSTTILLINQLSFDKKVAGKKLAALKAGAFSAIRCAEAELGSLPHVKTVNLVDSASLTVTADLIKILALKYHSDYVLALTDYNADVALEDIQNGDAYYNSVVIVKFTLFEGDGLFYKKLQGSSSSVRSIQPYMGFVASLFIHPTIARSKDSINVVSRNAVLIALSDYLPHTETLSRPLYTDKWLNPMTTEILAGNFDKAYNLSQPLLNDKNPIVAGRAAYNMAVVYEAQGDIDEAINMAQLSLDKYKNPYASAILNDLKSE